MHHTRLYFVDTPTSYSDVKNIEPQYAAFSTLFETRLQTFRCRRTFFAQLSFAASCFLLHTNTYFNILAVICCFP